MAPPPQWLVQLANGTARLLRALDVLAPVGCHFYYNRARDQWEVTLFASATEVVGGRQDGRRTTSRFTLDLARLRDVLDEVTAFAWQPHALGRDDDLGPHISLEGRYRGHDVWLRILAVPPRRFQAGRSLNVHTLKLEDLW